MAHWPLQQSQMSSHGSRNRAVVSLTNASQFDFGSGMPLPPSTAHHQASVGHCAAPGGGVCIKQEIDLFHPGAVNRAYGVPTPRSTFRSFSRGADMELLDYLRARKISPSFLNEIDQFLSAHPEIALHRPNFVKIINSNSPLDAYRFFVRGYTKPARYIEGALPDASNIPLSFDATPLVMKEDPELREFFAGYQYRNDILLRIDEEVRAFAAALYTGQEVPSAARKLVVFAWYGNLVDAYKYYEYNFQTEWLAHRYLPEHIILTQVPKPAGYTQPVPRVVSYEGEELEEMRSHLGTRARMARACDSGVDVIEVLLQDFCSSLARQGLKRPEIEGMKADALRNIDHQRQVGGGRDIVDMVMNRAQMTKPSDFGRETTKKTSAAMKRISSLKHSLFRLLGQEAAFHADEPDWVRGSIKKLRQRVERDLVYDVTKLAFDGGIMTSKERSRWCNLYVRKQQVQREASGHKIDLLTELSLYL